MNKKGFTLVELIATIILIAIIMGIVLPSALRTLDDNADRKYEEYEKMMVEYAIVSPLKGQQVIKLSELEELSKVKKDCNGYVVKISSSPLNYKAYISCGTDYKTTSYDATLAGENA